MAKEQRSILLGQYCFTSDGVCRLTASYVGVVCNAAGGRAGRPPGAWAVGWPTLHSGPVRLRPVRATPCYTRLRTRKAK